MITLYAFRYTAFEASLDVTLSQMFAVIDDGRYVNFADGKDIGASEVLSINRHFPPFYVILVGAEIVPLA